jgi:predicted DNA-binding protein (MmcQ/YjbR family)
MASKPRRPAGRTPAEPGAGMTSPGGEDPRLARLTTICLGFPETTRHDHGQHAAFLVRKKTFAYYLDNHHGDGIVAVSCKAAVGENAELAAVDPARFYLPAYIGPRGWVALRLDAGKVDWAEVAALAADSYRLIAPKRLAALASTLLLLLLLATPLTAAGAASRAPADGAHRVAGQGPEPSPRRAGERFSESAN